MEDFNLFLSNKNSLDKYNSNNVSQFTNLIYPPIKFDNIADWNVALRSIILPFRLSDISEHLKNPVDYVFIWEVTKLNPNYKTTNTENEEILNNIENQRYLLDRRPVTYKSHQLFQKTSKQIYNIMKNSVILGMATPPGQPPKGPLLTVGQFQALNQVSNDVIVLNKIINKNISLNNGIWQNIVKIELFLNTNAQDLLGLQDSSYVLFQVDENANKMSDKIYIVGNKKIDMNFHIPTYVHVYTDIIHPVRYGSNYVNLLDILSIDARNGFVERKRTELLHHKLKKNIINDVSITITDDKHEILKNHSEDVILCLHFTKKNNV